jgi:hypothetical protein
MDPGTDGAADASFRRRGAILLAVGLLLRVAWAMMAPADLWFDHVFNDVTARNLAAGNGFTASTEAPFDPAIFRTPGYPAFVAALYFVLGPSIRAVFLVQALLDTASCALAGRLVARRLGAGAGTAALALAVAYPFTIHAVGTLSPETLLVLLGLLLVAAVEALPPEGGRGALAAAGLLHGALCWVKPVFLPLPLILALAERWRGRTAGTALLRGAVVGALGVACFLPWPLRNQAIFGKPVLAGELGLVVWHGTRDFDPGVRDEIRANFDAAPADPAARYEEARRSFTGSREALEQDAAYLEAGLARIRERPVGALVADPLRRVPRLWISSWNVLLPPWAGGAAIAASLAFLALAAAGAWTLRGRLRELAAWGILPLCLTLGYAALHAEARYTLPARATLWLLGGAFVASLLPAARRANG